MAVKKMIDIINENIKIKESIFNKDTREFTKENSYTEERLAKLIEGKIIIEEYLDVINRGITGISVVPSDVNTKTDMYIYNSNKWELIKDFTHDGTLYKVDGININAIFFNKEIDVYAILYLKDSEYSDDVTVLLKRR